MGSGMGSIRRRLDPGGARSREEQRVLSELQPVPFGPPWGGYVPDVPLDLCSWRDCPGELDGLVPIGGTLRTPPGFARVDPDSLPLGEGDDEPVVALRMHRDVTVSPTTLRRYAVTADAALGHLYSLGANWTDIPYGGGGAGFSGISSGVGVAQTLCDISFFQPDNKLLFANVVDPVYFHVPGSADYEDFSPAVLNPFKARSCESLFERPVFLNTSEGGVAFPVRLRYGTRGGSSALTGVGSGLIDFREIEGEGVAVRKIGRFGIAYFRRGAAILRSTGNETGPIARDYIGDAQRGLLGTQAVTEIAAAMHFGIFSDGWFYVTDAGQFIEVGVRDVGDAAYPKWKETFYRVLNAEEAHRISLRYDPLSRGTWIAWPSAGSDHNDQVWFLHHATDAVFPLTNAFPQIPNVFGDWTTVSGVSVTWDTIVDPWSSEVRGWADMEPREGLQTVSYGTRSGLVLGLDRSLYTIDSVTPTYRYTAVLSNLGLMHVMKDFDRLDFDYTVQNPPAAPPLSITLRTNGGPGATVLERTITRAQLIGDVSNRISDYATARISGTALGFTVSGTAPFFWNGGAGHWRQVGKALRRRAAAS